ncbi:complement factor I-like [Scomber japonicus]|uniref:complement factor I-like n=1 Tax=Scomber japonicus TaxID=13676 RepID=UPI0023060D71|nr:complement factor I-like [Scomber japonicus]
MSSAAASLLLLFLSALVFAHSATVYKTDEFLGPVECLEKKFDRDSCDLVFCRPWQSCVNGRCSCKPPYKCPTVASAQVCSHSNKLLRSYCQAMAVSCQTKKPFMSHFGESCTADQPKFSSSLDEFTGLVRLFVPGTGGGEDLLVCQDQWDTAAANVACRDSGHTLGAEAADSLSYVSLTSVPSERPLPDRCVSVRCQGYESSLSECVIYNKTGINSGNVAMATCAKPATDEECDFRCVNAKCVSLSQTCDGVDDCGDRSDEMCCKKCRDWAFRCSSSGVCLPKEAVGDGQIDCLDGEDESRKHTELQTANSHPTHTEYISPQNEIRTTRAHMESKVSCGVPKAASDDDDDEDVVEMGGIRRSVRVKRVVGGLPTKPTQIQWQTAIMINNRLQCGGAYIGGCWVITAAHCLGPDPLLSKPTPGPDGQIFRKSKMGQVKFSLWSPARAQQSTDVFPIVDLHIHPQYNPNTRENDIALVQLEKLPWKEECLPYNPAITPVCVPWTSRLFNPNHTCSISGWGLQTPGGRRAQYLQWANVSLIEDCQRFHSDDIKPGMLCAGALDGSVDACQGDNGGPLVCEDKLGVSYLWGIISWGSCGRPRSPGVYTQVAHYFEWIRHHTGWPTVTKFNF